jgi:hypothetical protein
LDGIQQGEVERQEGGRHAEGGVAMFGVDIIDQHRRQQGRTGIESDAGDGARFIDGGLQEIGGVRHGVERW